MKRFPMGYPLVLAALVLGLVALKQYAAPAGAAAAAADEKSDAVSAAVSADGLVTLNADDALVTQILNAFSRQTGRSIVIGPEITGRTTVRLNNVAWDDALEAVLKPFGYAHYQAGEATVVTGVDPLNTRLIELKHQEVLRLLSEIEALVAEVQG